MTSRNYHLLSSGLLVLIVVSCGSGQNPNTTSPTALSGIISANRSGTSLSTTLPSGTQTTLTEDPDISNHVLGWSNMLATNVPADAESKAYAMAYDPSFYTVFGTVTTPTSSESYASWSQSLPSWANTTALPSAASFEVEYLYTVGTAGGTPQSFDSDTHGMGLLTYDSSAGTFSGNLYDVSMSGTMVGNQFSGAAQLGNMTGTSEGVIGRDGNQYTPPYAGDPTVHDFVTTGVYTGTDGQTSSFAGAWFR